VTNSEDSGPTADGPSDPEAIRADIEQARTELADTVDALSDKLNVKAQAAGKATAAKEAAKDKVGAAAEQVRAAAPPPVQHALDSVGEKAGPVVQQVAAKTEPHRSKIIAGAAAALVVLVVVRRRRKRPS
jgi:uncharacterized protein DUF3618